MVASFIATVPAMAFHTDAIADTFAEYSIVANYKGYTYASEGPEGSAIVALKRDKDLEISCKLETTPTGIELVQKCNVPVGIARHLKVLGHKGMSHDIVVPDISFHY